MADDQLSSHSPKKPVAWSDDQPIERDDGLHPAAQGCLVALGAKIGCLLLMAAILLFALFMAQFATFKPPKSP